MLCSVFQISKIIPILQTVSSPPVLVCKNFNEQLKRKTKKKRKNPHHNEILACQAQKYLAPDRYIEFVKLQLPVNTMFIWCPAEEGRVKYS